MKIIWIDLLCFGSFLKLIKLSFKNEFCDVYYCNVTKSFSKRVPFIAKFWKKTFMQVLSFEEGEKRIGDISCYEAIQKRYLDFIGKYSKEESVQNELKRFALKENFHFTFLKEHIEEEAYLYFFRIVELLVISEKITPRAENIYLIRKTPFSKIYRKIIQNDRVFLFTTFIAHRLKIENRPGYFYDKCINSKYFYDRFRYIEWTLKLWGAFLACAVIGIFDKKQINPKLKTNIGVEFVQSKVDLSGVNDIYWFKDSGIDPRSVFSIEREDYDDKSVDQIRSLGINRCKFYKNPIKLIKAIKKKDKDLYRIVLPFSYFSKTFKYLVQSVKALFVWNHIDWIRAQEALFGIKTYEWKDIFLSTNIRLLWSMYDVDADKMPKNEALFQLNGLFMGSHWSLHPCTTIEFRKQYDVLFGWGDYTKDRHSKDFDYLKIFTAGYPSDHYFAERKKKAMTYRNNHKNKYIISYHDNITAHDILYSDRMQTSIHKMLIDIINEHDNVMIFLKPKRKNEFEEIINKVPGLKECLDAGKIEVFLGETARTKVPPAEIGMASDLAIGLGLSTSACECFFAGTPSFHVDLTGFTNNEFGNNALGKIVFRDIASLKEAIEKRIKGEALPKDDRKYYDMLDPFQDGKTYLRTGFIIKCLQKGLGKGMSREKAVEFAEREYKNM